MARDWEPIARKLKSGLLTATEIATDALDRVDDVGVTTSDGIEAMFEALVKIAALAVTHDDELA